MYIVKRTHQYPYYAGRDKNIVSWSTTPDKAEKYDTIIGTYIKIAALQRYNGDKTMRPALEDGKEIL